jgi:ABC-type Na+ efflux pump, permease component
MNHLSNLIRKELKEQLTVGSLVTMLVMIIVLSAVGTMVGEQTAEISEPSEIGVVNLDEGTEYSDVAIAGVRAFYDDPDKYVIMITGISETERNNDIINAMKEHGLSTLLVIEKGFDAKIKDGISGLSDERGAVSIYWHQTDAGMTNSLSTAAAYSVIASMSGEISRYAIENDAGSSLAPDFTMNPVSAGNQNTILNGSVKEGVTPADVYNAVYAQSMFLPIMVMMIIITIGGTIIGSIGNEKENKTMETLLTLPVGRTTIVSGKLIGSAIVGLIYGGMYMVGIYLMTSGMSSMNGGSTVSLEELGLVLSLVDWTAVIAVLFLSIMCALGLCMIMGAFAKNYKSAQTMTLPLSILAMVPMFITMFSSFQALPAAIQAITFAIPFSHPMMAMQNLMFGETALVLYGLIYLVMFSLAALYVTVRLYKSDILVTGLIRKNKGKKTKE